MILHRRASVLFSLFALPIVLSLAGCSSLKSISVSPGSGSVVLTAIGQTAQFTALGTSQTGSASPTTAPVTVSWSVSNSSVATISSTGLATAVGPGYTQIMAESGGITASSDLTVTIAANTGGTTAGSAITAVNIIPGTQSIASPSQTTQFLAIGTTTTGATEDLTSKVTWSSSSAQIATIGANTGLATGVGQGTAAISAIYANTGGSVVVGTAALTIAGGTTEKYTAVQITPNTESLAVSGQTAQLIALAASGSTGLQTDVTSSSAIKWSSSVPTIATVSATGVVAGVSPGISTIAAELTNADGTVVANYATITITSTPAPEPLLSLTIIPSSITVGNLQDTGQFLAIGTYAKPPYVRDLTNSPNLTWISAFPSSFPVNTNTGGNAGATAGIVTAYGTGSAAIIAEATNPADGTIQTATATFSCPLVPLGQPSPSCYPGSEAFSLLSTLTIYNEGLNNTNWEVTAPSATGTANVVHCGPGWALGGGTGGSVCVATYPIGSTVVVEATGGAFGGWSYNCTPSDQNGTPLNPAIISSTGPNYCTVTFSPAVFDAFGNMITPANSNVTLGAIFN